RAWANDDAVDVGRPVTAFRDERLRSSNAAGGQRSRIGALEFHRDASVGRPPQLRHGRHIHARPGIDVVLAVRRVRDGMAAVILGHRREVRTVEIDSVAVDLVRVLAGVRAAGAKPDLPRGRVDAIDASHDPWPLGDLILYRAGDAV